MVVTPRSTTADRGMSKWMIRFRLITQVAVLKLRYEFANVSHSCGVVPYPSALTPHTNLAPAIVFAHVEVSAGFGFRVQTNAITIPMLNRSVAQMRRPA